MDSFDFKNMRSEISEVYQDWADIPGDVLRYIVSKTHSIKDFIRIAAVCRSWQVSLKDDQKPEFPICLMIGEKEHDGVNRCFYTTSHDQFLKLELPEIKRRRCWGTLYGIDFKIQLFNPLSRLSFPLPSSPSLELFIDKFLLSSTPTSPDCIVMAIYSRNKSLFFTKLGDQSWTPIDSPYPLHDINCFNGDFFAVTNSGQLLICQDLNRPPSRPKAVEFAQAPPNCAAKTKHIVDLGGYLCMIVCTVIPFKHKYFKHYVRTLTWEFEIFKLDMVTRKWERIWSLGDRSVFIGNCCSFSVLAADHRGCRSNCIYFADDDNYVFSGGIVYRYLIGIYNCDNKEVNLFPESKYLHESRYLYYRPLWIKPSSQ